MKIVRLPLSPIELDCIYRAQRPDLVPYKVFREYLRESDMRLNYILSKLPIENPESAIWDNRR